MRKRTPSNSRRAAWLLGPLVTALLLSGCAVYQHRLIEPEEFAGPIDRDGIAFFMDPLEYRAVSRDGRLALRIVNLAAAPITLIGERSYLVDPTGETRALSGGTIAPAGHVTMEIPPQPVAVRAGPRFGVGVGAGTGFRRGHLGVGAHHGPWAGYPTHVYVSEAEPWRWITGAVRLRLMYDDGGEPLEHHLVIEREKMN